MIVNVLEAYASETGTKTGKAGNSNGKELRVAKRDTNDFDYIIRLIKNILLEEKNESE